MKWFQKHFDAVLQELDSHPTEGLKTKQIEPLVQKFGANQLEQAKQVSALFIFLQQFKNPLLIILSVGVILSLLIGHTVDAIAIGVIIVLNALISFSQEYHAQRSIEALKKMAAPIADVCRDGNWQTLAAVELVPGDLVKLTAGSIVPADLRLIQTESLQVDEAALTGESVPVYKQTSALSDPMLALGDQTNMAFMSTYVTEGQGLGLVVATGMKTEVGHIAHLMEAASGQLTPLQIRMHKLTKVLIFAALIIVSIVLGIGLLNGMPAAILMTTGISLAVAAIPEGLMTLLTIVLTLGARQMFRNHALVRQLASVETLGSTSVICSDKTGTLTQNKMQVTQIWCGGHAFHLTGEGYQPSGEFLDLDQKPVSHLDYEHLQTMLKISAICNEARLEYKNQQYQIQGSPTEGALLVAAAKAGLYKSDLFLQHQILKRFPFDPKRKMMSVIVKDEQQQLWLFTKGAPDILLQHSEALLLANKIGDLPSDQTIIEGVIQQFAEQALRTLAIGYRKLSPEELDNDLATLERRLTLVGIHGIIDPPRPAAIDAVAKCHSAGIRVMMITGDHALTAKAIARQMGIIQNGQQQVIEGHTLNQMDDATLIQQVQNTAVFARVTPEHKLRIVQALQANKQVVAMTGDGVNDAPALRKAEMGIAMGITGTGVAKESADLILLDDNFTSIVKAVEEGRRIYDNIRKFIRQDLTTNVGEVSALLFAFILMTEEPLLTLAPLMILWVNLVSDGLPSLALGVDTAEKNIMQRKPRSPDEGFFFDHLGKKIIIRGLVLGAVTYGVFHYALMQGHSLAYSQTFAFMTLILGQLVLIFDSRTFTSLYRRNPFSNKTLLLAVSASAGLSILMVYSEFGHQVLGTTPLSAEHLWTALFLGALPTLLLSGLKEVFKLKWI